MHNLKKKKKIVKKVLGWQNNLVAAVLSHIHDKVGIKMATVLRFLNLFSSLSKAVYKAHRYNS